MMMVLKCTTTALFIALLGVPTTASKDNNDDDCSLYMAESSIRNAGWGVFTTKSLKLGDRVGPRGIGIPFIDPSSGEESAILSQYLWRSGVTGGFHEATRVSFFLPGIGSLANYHAMNQNLVEGGFTISTGTSAGDGSSTSYHNHSFVATRVVAAGEELFLGGGSLEREMPWRDYPSESAYTRANEIIAELASFQESHADSLSEMEWIDFLYRLQHEMMLEDTSAVKELMPETFDELMLMKKKGSQAGLLIERDLDWVKEHGYCLDYIQEGTNDGGRGAFATRSLQKGSVISPAPVIPVNASVFRIHNGPENATIQLLANYCFGHAASPDMLFCPTTQIVLLNHDSTNANAALRWAKSSANRRDADFDLLKKNASEIEEHYRNFGHRMNAPLLLEVYALKDIKERDEIYLDYTNPWMTSFESFNQQKKGNVITAKPVISYVTPDEHVDNLPDGAHVYECRVEPLAVEYTRAEPGLEDYRGRPYMHPSAYSVHFQRMYLDNDFCMWYPCSLERTNDGGATFQVTVFSKYRETQTEFRRFTNLPRASLRKVQGPYQSNLHSPNVFRHHLPLSDKLFPARWRNDYIPATAISLGIVDSGLSVLNGENAEQLQFHEEKIRKVACGNYFAPSNIPEAGFSQYTAVPYVGAGIMIGSEIPAVVIPALYNNDHKWIISEYVWNGKSYHAEYEVGQSQTAEVLGASLANFHPGILNMGLKSSEFRPVLDTCADPGAGASTDYLGCSFVSGHTLEAGEELFVSYGDEWFMNRKEFGDIALGDNYRKSDELVASVWALSSSNGQLAWNESDVSDLIAFSKAAIVREPRTQSALDSFSSWLELENAIERNGTARATMGLRSLEWFEEHGQCMDHVYVNRSTIHQAGQGAFTRRFLKEGTTIISSPLIHVFDRKTMVMNTSLVDGVKINPTMQLLNYQYSHPNSSVFFLPINQMVGINHNSKRMKDGVAANARIQWATWNKKSLYIMQKHMSDLKKEKYSTLVMDVVASRDIAVDEEIFIDYGEEWEAAWKTHAENWKSPCGGARKVSAKAIFEMNHAKQNVANHAWTDQHFAVCGREHSRKSVVVYIKDHVSGIREDGSGVFVTNNYEGITVDDDGFKVSDVGQLRYPCKIMDSDPSNNTFRTVLFFFETSSLEIHDAMPANNVLFLPRPYLSDMHLPGAFRHEIKIPDDIFPTHWMDL